MQPENQRTPDAPYTVIPRVLVFLTCVDRVGDILLLRGAPDKKLWAGKYNGLGGHVEPGETPYQAAVREVYEEAGLTVDALILRAVVHATLPEPPGVLFFVFVGDVTDGELRPSVEGMPVWVARTALETVPLVEDLPQLLPRVLAPGPVIFAHYAFTEDGLRITFD